jgi:hypothetical protein
MRSWAAEDGGSGFCGAELAETGRPGYDPRDLLKLYVYGYLQQVRSSRLKAECQRNVEVMWLLGRLQPDYKSIVEFRRMHREAVTAAGAELIRLARSVGLVDGAMPPSPTCCRSWPPDASATPWPTPPLLSPSDGKECNDCRSNFTTFW